MIFFFCPIFFLFDRFFRGGKINEFDVIAEVEGFAKVFPGDATGVGFGSFERGEGFDKGLVAAVGGIEVFSEADLFSSGEDEGESVEFLEGTGEFERGGEAGAAFFALFKGAVAEEVDGVLEGELSVEEFKEGFFEFGGGVGVAKLALGFEDFLGFFFLIGTEDDGGVGARGVAFAFGKFWVFEKHFTDGAVALGFHAGGVFPEGGEDFAAFFISGFGFTVGFEAPVLGQVKEDGGEFEGGDFFIKGSGSPDPGAVLTVFSSGHAGVPVAPFVKGFVLTSGGWVFPEFLVGGIVFGKKAMFFEKAADIPHAVCSSFGGNTEMAFVPAIGVLEFDTSFFLSFGDIESSDCEEVDEVGEIGNASDRVFGDPFVGDEGLATRTNA